jgi:hypothetical protein
MRIIVAMVEQARVVRRAGKLECVAVDERKLLDDIVYGTGRLACASCREERCALHAVTFVGCN